MNRELSLEVENRLSLSVIHVKGQLAQLEVYKLKNQCEMLQIDGRRFFLLDLREVELIDSAGIGSLIHLFNSCRKMGGAMAVVRPIHHQPATAMDQASIHQVIPFFDSVDDAKVSFHQKFGLPMDADAARVPPPINDPIRECLEAVVSRLSKIETRLSAIEKAVTDHPVTVPEN